MLSPVGFTPPKGPLAVQTRIVIDVEGLQKVSAELSKWKSGVNIKHRLWGQIDPQAVESAIHLSEIKYCSVGAMISKTAMIESTFEISPEPVPENQVADVG